MKRLADILLSLAALLLLAACTDDADVYNNTASAEGNLCVYVPVTRDANGAMGGLGASNPTYNASIDECHINDLHLYAFPVGGNGTLLSQVLPSPDASSMINEQVASYQLKIKPGTYRVYVVANMNDVLDDKNITTEDALKNMVLGYAPMSKPGMPVVDNIPMIYEPATKAADGTTTDGTITISSTDKTAKTVVANMRFTCVKVCLNLLFDPNAPDVNAALKANGLQISEVLGKQLSPQTNLIWNQKFSNPDVGSVYAKGIESKLYDASASVGNGAYYSLWKENPDNANVNDVDIISVVGEGTAAPVNNKEKWLFRATYYLPERYVAKASQQSALKINGVVGSGIENSYNINLGHRMDETLATEVPTFPRSTYYEIVGHLKSLGNINLDCIVGVKDWQMATVDVDLNHTTLWVSKTKAEVKSLQNDYIDYNTNAANVSFGCNTKVYKNGVGDLEIIKASNDPLTHRVTFSINPDLSIADFKTVLKGTAKVWIKAGNIKKYIDVEYDVKPFFNVDPVDIVIFYNNDVNNKAELTKVVKFTTNLGGIQFPSGWTVSAEDGQKVQYAQSEIKIKCDNNIVADGTFTITATSDPGTTTTHLFTVSAIDDSNVKQQIRVTVRPPAGFFIIYMRAINDLAWCRSDWINNDEYEHSLMLDEQAYDGKPTNNNWRDGWYEEGNNVGEAKWGEDYSPHNGYHYVYIYTQIGETASGSTSETRNTAEWYFGGKTDYNKYNRNTVSQGLDKNFTGDWWPGLSMTADNNNPGWYYYKIAHNAKSVGNNDKGQAKIEAEKMIKPGQTLLVFSNGTFLDKGFQSHRFTHHNDPGITLFNFEDREGWYLYDPTSDPYYRVYDEKPTVVDVEYTIYTKNQSITGWYVNYGVKNGDGTQKFSMWSDSPISPNQFECKEYGKDSNGKIWYKTILHLKAPLGYYDKILHVKISNTGLEPELFDGDNYPSTKKNGSRYVVEGQYDPDTKTWKQGAPF